MLIPVLLSGGVGSRLWPLSRELNPKQFLALTGEESLLGQTLSRAALLQNSGPPMVVCNDEHRFIVAERLREHSQGDTGAIILEPVGRNTAPAVAVAALQALQQDESALLLVLPADHVIQDESAFVAAVEKGMPHAEQGRLVTFGIVPTSPETGFGYIAHEAGDIGGGYPIRQFVEKPDAKTARSYLADGSYLWNSGMFLLGARAYLDELSEFSPEILAYATGAVDKAEKDLDFVRLNNEQFSLCPSDSIDYAVMEKTSKGVVVPLDCGWSDVGSWSTLWEIGEQDEQGNVAEGDVLLCQSNNSYVRSESRLVATLGVDNLVVVETADAVLVADKQRVQDVKAIVSQLKSSGRSEVNTHVEVYRPWGTYEPLAVADRFQVKRIVVNPGQRLSLQMHHHRAEHWVVVRGTAKVTCGDNVMILSEDQSTYIPLGTQHRLENPGVIPLEVIEVQSGSYLGEDDIIRFEDIYGRSQ